MKKQVDHISGMLSPLFWHRAVNLRTLVPLNLCRWESVWASVGHFTLIGIPSVLSVRPLTIVGAIGGQDILAGTGTYYYI